MLVVFKHRRQEILIRKEIAWPLKDYLLRGRMPNTSGALAGLWYANLSTFQFVLTYLVLIDNVNNIIKYICTKTTEWRHINLHW